ncbi:hypothetical protein BW730_14690 [Tessaracoccus aquimaris]|uniref:VWFA domain-containing protein n=1 Tax=Tessaracoccus aquimaris TaxID=1332264 RepID=A0A1Q2CR28_9ACTN|nr:SpaA isopeptide-forming pilin-related protein [Tessaracoccus aquimaris]AQP48562.1 hypothetical protein BW730_14690 [Tessaracoccus aquimaris]
MSTNDSLGSAPRRRRSRLAAREGRRRALAIGIVSALSASLVFASGLAYANDPTSPPEPVETTLAVSDQVEVTLESGEGTEVIPPPSEPEQTPPVGLDADETPIVVVDPAPFEDPATDEAPNGVLGEDVAPKDDQAREPSAEKAQEPEGLQAEALAAPAPKGWVVTVQKGTYRTAGTADTVSGEHTVGVRFGMSVDTSSDPFAYCEIQPGNEGNCVFPEVITPPDGDLTVVIREQAPTPGSDAAIHLGTPIKNLSTLDDYRIEIALKNNNKSPVVPKGMTNRAPRVANRVVNPQLNQTCGAGAKVAVLLDTSGSVNGFQDTLARATTALVDGLVGTPSSVALLSFAQSSPGAISNQKSPLSVQAVADAADFKKLYATNDGKTASFVPKDGTNWDKGLWETSLGSAAYKYDVVFVLTDGNPTYSIGAGDGRETTTRELENAVFSANAIKKTGARVITVGIGSNLNDNNLAAISGPTKFAPGMSLSDFDYISADWAKLEGVLSSFAEGLKCEASITVEKQAKPYGGTYAPAEGWKFGLANSGAASQIPAPTESDPEATQATDAAGKAKWTLKFDKPGDEATATLTELEDRTGWSLADLTCDVGGTTVDLAGKKVSIEGIGIGENITCTFKNEEKLVGALDITKALTGADAQKFGASVDFQGGFTCSLNNATVASGTWAKIGAGAATLTPAAGTPAANQIPANAVCTVTETTPTGGLPNPSWTWATPTVTGPVTIASGTTSTVTVTNAVERVYGNFQVTKQLAEGSTADATLTYSGGWTCTLGAEEVSGVWGPIAADVTWASTDADRIPLGASCAVTSETRDQWPVADDHSHQWDGEAGFSAAVVSSKQDLGTVTVTNTTKRVLGSVTWSKVDATDESLLGGSSWTIAGPSFPEPGKLVEDCVADDPAQCVGLDTNPAEGEFALKDLLWGEYTVNETGVPTGYVGGLSFTFTVAEATLDVAKGAQANERRPGAVSWSKTDEVGDLLGGSVWSITPPEGGEITVEDCIALDAKDCTGADRDPAAGKFLVEGLAWGTHLIAETTPPQGYDGEASFSVEITAEVAGKTIDGSAHKNTALTGTLKWFKIDADSESKPLLGGSEWTLRGPGDAKHDIKDCVGTCTDDPFTDQDPVAGQFSIVGLVWGDYTLTEKTAPEGYTASDESFPFTIDATNVTQTKEFTIENTRETGTVTWSKVDATDKSLLAGSKWTLKDPENASHEVVDCIGTCSDDPFTDQDPVAGQFSIKGLVWGDYELTESKAPSGYDMSTDPILFTIDATNVAGIRHLGDIGNERILGSVGWTKVDGAGTLLAGSEWSLTAPNGTTVVIEDCIETGGDKCLGPDKNPGAGSFVIEDLEWGAYTLVETKAPPGYALDATEHPFTIGADELAAGLGPIRNVAHEGPVLPLTGGIGRDQIILAGAFVALLAAVGYGARRRFARGA